MRTVNVNEFLTEEEIETCINLYPDINAIERVVIEPNIRRIDVALQQENDCRFLAYCVFYAIQQTYVKNIAN